MPPHCPKSYPLTRTLSQYFSPASSKNKPLELDGTAGLAVYQRTPVNPYLKEVVRHLRDPLELFPNVIIQAQCIVRIELNGVIMQEQWELTIKKTRRSLCTVLDALGILHQGLFHSNFLLEHVEQFLDESKRSDADLPDSKKFSEEDVQKLTKLKEHLLNLNKFLDCVLLNYSSFSCELPDIEKVKRAAKKLYKVIKNLKPDRLKNLVPEGMVFSEEYVLCSVLGLHNDFAARLRNLSPEMRNHKTDMCLLLCFLKERDESPNVENLRDTAAVECSLQKMGFTENRSNVIAKWIAEQPFPEHRSLLAWTQIYIENVFKYDIFLNDEVHNFPYKERYLDGWFSVNVEDCEGGDGRVPQVSVINTNTKEKAIAHIENKIAEFKESNPKGQLYFHGTDHDSVKNILECGIKLGKGSQICDFSNGCGFYVADNFKYALEEHAMKSKLAAVILFNISDDCLKKGLDLSGAERQMDLKSVIKYFRSGEPRSHGLGQKLYQEIKKCHYIFGPMSRDGSRKCEIVQQICIKKEEMAEEMGNPSHVAGIVFINTGAGTELARR
ncbi:uncharacterized protein LOC111086092 [Paramuricea clavata]|uniref:Uncharacterized protein LOC111086092 n=1 Tax=Paramuricea clavata TaxID=317549 RepID=A0A7D9KDH2_PARCT|nr:uncharacterized protein LOC111086092 [Paramuricea clavata]